MRKLVDLDTAIDKVLKESNADGAYGYMDTEDIVDLLNNLSPAQPEQRWIPVDLQNNSPEENQVVLLGVRFRDDFKYFVTSRQDYNYWIGLGREINGELRWKPLPEPWRAEGRTDERTD
jgi:hypothetical protein